MKKVILLMSGILLGFAAISQDLYVYHGRKDETLVYNSKKETVSSPVITKKVGEKFKVTILNPNPIYYSYEIKYEEQEDKTEDKETVTLLTNLAGILKSTSTGGGRSTEYNDYIQAVDDLTLDIKTAGSIIADSDVPELPDEAIAYKRTSGLRKAVDEITSNTLSKRLTDDPGRFHSANLSGDLKDLLAKIPAADADAVTKRAFTLLNESLVAKVVELKKQMGSVKTILSKDFVVTRKVTKVYLIIKQIDPNNKNLVRLVHSGDEKLEIGEIHPLYDRRTLEIVPVGMFVFVQDAREFYLENDLVNERRVDDIRFSAGIVLNINAFRFGESEEMSVGFGPGYKLSADSKRLNSFFFSSMFSYKNFLRIGLGMGFSQSPSGLKDGGKVGEALPATVKNLDDIIKYEDRLAGFLTISFTGLDLTKK